MMVDNKVAYLIPLSAQKAMPAKRRLSSAVGSTTEDSKMSDGNSPGGSNAGSERGRSATPEPGRKRKKIDVVSSNNGNNMVFTSVQMVDRGIRSMFHLFFTHMLFAVFRTLSVVRLIQRLFLRKGL